MTHIERIKEAFKTQSNIEKFAFLTRTMDFLDVSKNVIAEKQNEIKPTFEKYMNGDFDSIYEFFKIAGKELKESTVIILKTDAFTGNLKS